MALKIRRPFVAALALLAAGCGAGGQRRAVLPEYRLAAATGGMARTVWLAAASA